MQLNDLISLVMKGEDSEACFGCVSGITIDPNRMLQQLLHATHTHENNWATEQRGGLVNSDPIVARKMLSWGP